MVVKVIGTVDDIEVVFKYNQVTGKWETTVPRDLDGTYVVDLWAFDEAGNRGYYATVLFTVDPDSLHVVMELLKYRLRPICCGFSLSPVSPKPRLESLTANYTLRLVPTGYKLERGHDCVL